MTATAHVLFLDCNYRPLAVHPLRRAMTKLANGKVEVVEWSRDRTIYSAESEFKAPSVVRVLRSFRRDKLRVKFSRLNIYARDAFTCQYCRERCVTEDLNFDHVVPRSQGGKTCWENIVTSCVKCNSTKGNRTPEQAGMSLLRRPKKPHFLPAVMVRMDASKMPPEWANYWDVAIEQ